LKNQGFYIDTSDLQAYVKYLQTLSYKDMIRESAAVVRQTANDMKAAYKSFVPESEREGATKKYGFTSGNLRRSLGVYRKRQTSIFMVEFSVGFKQHKSGELARKVGQGKRAYDGYYGAWVDAGVAGRQKGQSETKSNLSRRFRKRAESAVNNVYQAGMSARGRRVLEKKLTKIAEGKK
jgi:hypothetical protein